MSDAIEVAATPIMDLQSVLDMTVAEYLTTSLHRDLGALSAAPALSEHSILPRPPPILIAQYIKNSKNEQQVVMLRSKVESLKEPVCIYFWHCIAA